MTRAIRVFALLCMLSAAMKSLAQVPTGAPPFGSFAGGLDNLDLANLNAHWTFPVLHKPGRGMNFDYDNSYDSATWYPVTSGNTTSWQPTNNWGWRPQTEANVGYVTYLTFLSPWCCAPSGYPCYGSESEFSQWVYHDAGGVNHSFNMVTYGYGGQCGGSTTSATQTASDGSGYTLTANGGAVTSLTTPYGTNIIPPFGGPQTGAATITDNNGNIIKTDGQGKFYDTLSSTTPVLTITGSGTPSSATVFTYTTFSGSSASYTMQYTSYTVQTRFGCSGVSEYGPTSVNLVSEIDLPDYNSSTNPNSRYVFTYETTPGDSHTPHYVTGRIASVTLPTGGIISYTYSGGGTGVNGINCTDGSGATLTRTTPDGTWTYAHTGSASGSSTTTVTDPQGNNSVLTFQQIYETQRLIYNGAVSPSNLLRTVNTCYNASANPCVYTTITLPITQRQAVLILASNSQQSEHDDFFNTYGLRTESDDYDYGASPHGALLKKIGYSYANLGGSLNGFVSSTQISDSTGTVQYRQDVSYDQSGDDNTPCVTGAPSHDDTHFGCTVTARGNATSTTTYVNPSNGTGPITKTSTYDSLGNIRTAQLNCCNQKSWSFSSTTGYAFPDSITRGSGSTTLTTSYTYDNNTGLMKTAVDENNKTISFSYDLFGRPLTITRPDTSVVTYTYANPTTRQVTSPIDGSNSVSQIAALDALGRTSTLTTQDSTSHTWSIVQTQYDSLGRPYKASNPYTGSPSNWTVTQFDALGRTSTVTLQDNSKTTYFYTDPTVTITDPTGTQRKMQYDALGRLVSLWEPDPSNGNTLTLQTTYTYTVLDTIQNVTQGSQSRTYAYDGLGRLLSNTTPEAGRICFGSVTGSTCNSDGYDSFNNLLKRTDARGVLTSYTYDGLNRLQTVSYNVGTSGVPATPGVTFTYGTNQSQFNNGRLITMSDGVGSESYAYDQMGNATQLQKVINGVTYATGYAYNYAAEVTSVTYPSGRKMTQNIDPIGRMSSIQGSLNSVQTTYASGYSYNAASELLGFQYGNNLYASMGYSADRLQLTCVDYSPTNRNGCTHDSTTKFGLSYSYGTAQNNNGLISSITDSVDNGRSVTYTYDALYRLSTATTTGSANYPQWGYSWGYDRYGNRLNQTLTAGTGYHGSVTVDPTTNRIVQTTGTTYAYDANGNMTNDNLNALVYDAENRILSATNGSASGTYTYDGYGHRVKKVSGTTTTVYIFSRSKVIAEYDNGAAVGSPSREYVYGGSSLLAKIDPSGTKYYHRDHLSNRLVTDSAGNTVEQMGHYPFGDSWYNATNDKLYFTTYERDAESGNDYAMARSYVSRLGRFSAPDPVVGTPQNPQTLNRYAYVANNPINLVDPFGTFLGPSSGIDEDEDAGPGFQEPDPTIFPPGLNAIPIQGSGGGCAGCIHVNIPPPPPPPGYENCKNALKAAHKDFSALDRALDDWGDIESAAAAQGIPPELLAAVGIRETGFQNITGDYGHGHGIYQLDDRWNSPAVIAVAYDPAQAANIAASKLSTSIQYYAGKGIGGKGLYAASLRDYNASPGSGHGKVWDLGAAALNENQRPYWLDIGTANGDYVSNTLNIALNCF